MRSTKGAVLGYAPGPLPADLSPSARRYLDEELHRISAVLQGLLVAVAPELASSLSLKTLHAAPASPKTPMIVHADGVDWDPGSGAGYYYWNGMVWTPLG